jgi:parallel beta-helix repeat protein
MYRPTIGRRRFCTLILAVLLLVPLPFLHLPDVEATSCSPNETRADYPVIQIFMDAEMEDAAVQYGWNGNGTAGNPYIIEGMDIDCTGYPAGLSINWVHHHFIVRNNTIRNLDAHSGVNLAGISLSQTFNATVVGNVIRDCSPNGLLIRHYARVRVENNTFIDNEYHIRSETESILTAENNSFSCSVDGLGESWFRGSTAYILNNTFSCQAERVTALQLDDMRMALVEGNSISGYETGISTYRQYDVPSTPLYFILNNTIEARIGFFPLLDRQGQHHHLRPLWYIPWGVE